MVSWSALRTTLAGWTLAQPLASASASPIEAPNA
jgi:hypothetical protein